MIPTPPIFDSLDINVNSALQTVLLLIGCVIGGLLAGKQESDAAKAGIGDKTKENVSIIDWLEDGAYGFIGGMIGMAILQTVPSMPVMVLPAFGFAGRKILIQWGRKAEDATEGIQK